APLR
ncbi:hypothetical protein QUC31_001490, partial [Theobroma cacao]